EAIGNQLSTNIYEIDENADFFDNGLDSVGFINVIIALENEYDIFIDQDELDLKQFSTVKNIREFIESKI
ncbi:MAG: phosphopantetheine-binding protein, partial [Acutalibacteraceae bacterium]|nr:phosphopantetheine-binding protein [Acutalibacteraceae bacterium]